MTYNTTCNLKEEQLAWDNYIPKHANTLIIGTFPTVKEKRHFEFFYPNKNNPFWLVLSKIANCELIPAEKEDAIKNRKDILKKLNLGITDMGYRILRHDNSSLDQSILPVEFMNIFQLLNDHDTINKIILTSSSGKNSTEGWFRSYCNLNGVNFAKLKGNNPKRTKLIFNNKSIEIVCVHSTSRVAGKSIDALVDMYRLEILNDN